MFMLSFINVGFVILLVNFNLGAGSEFFEEYNIPVLQGSFDTFSVEWYRLVGSTICVTLLLNIVTPHGSNIAF